MPALVLLFLLLSPAWQARTRIRPPESITCDRNQLTAFSGTVTQWMRDDTTARLSMDTDADTKESFTIRFDKRTPPEKLFLLGGEAFRSEDWNKVELSKGRLRPGIQATVWVCEGGANPVVDWRLPAK
jgi:hypothetical protein